MQDSRGHPERSETLWRWLRRLPVLLSLALVLLLALTSCDRGGSRQAPPSGAGPSSTGSGDRGGGNGGTVGSPPTSGDRGGSPPTTAGSSLDRYEALAERELQPGSIAYNPPQQMRFDERTRIEARVTRHPDSTFTSNLQGKGASRVEELPVGTKMRGELLSDDFSVTPLRPEVQQLGAKGFRSWVWEIRPSRTGELSLTLVLSVVYDGDILDYRSFDRTINVSVTPTYAAGSWLSRNWDKMLGASGVTATVVVGAIVAIFRRRRARKPEGADSDRASLLEHQRNSR